MKKSEMVRGEMIFTTVGMAEEWLKKNLCAIEEGDMNNRKLKCHVVQKYLGRMARGEWNQANGDSIKFDADGNLIDGQHRLHAQIKNGRSMWWFVVSNCRRDAFKTLDDNTPRRAPDMLSIHGESNCNVLASVLNAVSAYKDGMLSSGRTVGLTNAQVFEAASAEKENGIEASIAIAMNNRGPKGFLSPSIVAFVHYMASAGGNADKADAFTLALCSQEPVENDQPIRLLRKRLTENLAGVKRASRITVMAWCVKAWNAFYERKQLNSAGLRFKQRPSKDSQTGKIIAPAHEFPKFVNQ